MTGEEFVGEILAGAKENWQRYWSSSPDSVRLRLGGMETAFQEMGRQLQEGLWSLFAESLDDLGVSVQGRCESCGYRRERRRESVEIDVLGHRVKFPCSYLYCRRCHTGVNPVRRWLGIEQGGVSLGLQRAVTDLTTRMTFGDAVDSISEHHAQKLDRTKAERLTYDVGAKAVDYLCERRKKAGDNLLGGEGPCEEQLVFTADGGMIPIGEFSRPTKEAIGPRAPKTEARKLAKGTRSIVGRESRFIAVRSQQSRQSKVVDCHIAPYEQTDYTGARMRAAASEAGLKDHTHIHGVFDMGSWIQNQFEKQFDSYERSACADIMHVTDYLIDAGRVIAGHEGGVAWGMMQKRRLLEGHFEGVLADLEEHRCTQDCVSDEHPKCRVLTAAKHLVNNRRYMDAYDDIRKRELPVGSGEAESGIRHHIKRRLSVAGAWTEANADKMLALISIRASGWWDDFWNWQHEQDKKQWHHRQTAQFRPRFRAARAAANA